MFWVLSRTCLAIYSRIPIFGRLRVALGVIRNQDRVLAIERNDGRGFCFPGGLAMPWEDVEKAAHREILEETGLRVTRSALSMHYLDSVEIPVDVSVFEVEAEGELRASWEGTPRWVEINGLVERVLPSQRRIAEALDQS